MSQLVAVLSLVVVVALFVSMAAGAGRAGRRRMFRVLIPSWRFFAEPSADPQVYIAVDGGRSLPLIPRALPPAVPFFWDPEGSARLVLHGIVEQALEEGGEGGTADEPLPVSVVALQRVAQERLRSEGLADAAAEVRICDPETGALWLRVPIP